MPPNQSRLILFPRVSQNAPPGIGSPTVIESLRKNTPELKHFSPTHAILQTRLNEQL